ncbi:MAG: hypothetical protein QOI74_2789 [Micromonosporaceae bacterium]|nr:hypothetical protein [Micromonosporaceae bacterium]MDT5038862.1 hypothetical protein [Micromonosporaceae bacterium]
MARYTRAYGPLPQRPAGDPTGGPCDLRALRHRSGEHGEQEHSGHRTRAHEQDVRTALGQHADHLPECAEPDHATTVQGTGNATPQT